MVGNTRPLVRFGLFGILQKFGLYMFLKIYFKYCFFFQILISSTLITKLILTETRQNMYFRFNDKRHRLFWSFFFNSITI